MKFYTNSKNVKVLIVSLTSLEVQPFDKHVPESKEVDLVLLDHEFCYGNDEHTLPVINVFVRRPDWGRHSRNDENETLHLLVCLLLVSS